MLMNSGEYLDLVQSIKQEIQSAQYRAVLNVNRDLICLYYDIGSAINEHKTWGNKAAPHNLTRRLSQDFCSNSKFEKWRNTVCISHFSS